MKIVFWTCWLIDVILAISTLSVLLKTYTSGAMATKSKADIFNFIGLVAGMIVIVITAIILYQNCWQKTAALIASLPILSLLFIFLIPIIAYLSGERMN